MRMVLPAIFGSILWALGEAESVPLDLSGVRPGPVEVRGSADSVTVRWPDEASRNWEAQFSLDPAKPLISSIAVVGNVVLKAADPLYWCETGKRTGGWDAYPSPPVLQPEGTRRFRGQFKLRSARVRTVGDRVELFFDGLTMGIFEGGIVYTVYPGSRLVQQEARVTTSVADTAYYYDTGIQIDAESDRRPGRHHMESEFAFFDTEGRLHSEIVRTASHRTPLPVRYRTLATKTAGGSVAVFPPPHKYFYARNFTTNQGYVWRSTWDGFKSLGVRQWPDDNTEANTWFNAPPGTEQRMAVFVLLSDQPPGAVLSDVLAYTHRDRFPSVPGYITLTAHWHQAYTVQAMVYGFDWVPLFKPVFKELGVNALMLSDFHGDGHARDLTDLRLQELDAYFRACRAQSDADFLLIPSEEARGNIGGHWSVVFPKPVYWFMRRPPGAEFRSEHPRYGLVYAPATPEEVMEMVRRENGLVYHSHARIKGSRGFPDKIRETQYYRDSRYFGGSWKAHPVDLSSPRAGEVFLTLLDDMNNWGLPKKLLGEVDMFETVPGHEVYGHMNVNYVKAGRVPDWDHYGELLDALARGDSFITTGEILLPRVSISTKSPDEITVQADLQWTFPLRFAEVVWGDGSQSLREVSALETTRPFGKSSYSWKVKAKGWTWARLAVWDVAGNGAFINPVRR